MRVLRLQIEQQMARIGVESQNARLKIDMKFRKMNVERSQIRMTVDKEDGKVELDMKKFFDNIGLKSARTLTSEGVSAAKSKASAGIREIANNAKFMRALPYVGNRIGQLYRSKILEKYTPNFNIAVPDDDIKMHGDPGDIKINWYLNDIKITWDEMQLPTIKVEPKISIDIYMAQKPSIEYTVVEEYIPPEETGATLDIQL